MANLINCKTCGKEVSSDAKACPHCGQKLKMGLFKKLLIGVSGLFLLLILIGIFSGNDQPTSSTTKPAKEEPVYTANVEGVGKIKGIVRSNVGIAVVDVKKAKILGDNPYAQAHAQGQFIIVKVVVTNNQKDAVTLDSNSFKIIDDKNREFSHSVEADTALAVSNGSRETLFLKKINPGITTTGYIVFDVPLDISGAKLQVRGGMTGDKGILPLEVQKAE